MTNAVIFSKPLTITILMVLTASLISNGILLILITQKPVASRVVDGDSLDLNDGRRIRLLSVDAPERERCAASDAREYLSELVVGKPVEIRDMVSDDYGRILANMYAEDKFVNGEMVKAGLAKFVSVRSPEFENLKTLSEEAKREKRGIYAESCRSKDPTTTCTIKGNSRAGKRFFYPPDCRLYDTVIVDRSFGDEWFCTEEEARKSGFQLASSCRE